jgi:predicted ATPase
MKIDIHVHTKKIKSGDAPTRNIDSKKFVEIIKNTDVRILAITNHNHFDLEQYKEFVDASGSNCQIWPGIELDVVENGKRGHLIAIVNPKNSLEFSKVVDEIIAKTDPDAFTVSIEKTVHAFDKLDCIYIAHYQSKKPSLGDEELAILENYVSNKKRILKEATNSISAGIYVSHGHNSIYGSDVQDWDQYILTSKELPDLRLPVDTFDQFCLLLEKDEATINTLLDRKVKETIELTPFGLAELIRLDIYNDINVLFGSKGTGKTEILEALSKYFNSKGHKTSVYKSNDNHLDDEFDLKGNKFILDIDELGIKDCANEIKLIKEATEEGVTSMQKYLQHFTSNAKNKIAQKLKIKDYAKVDEGKPQRKLNEVNGIWSEFKKFKLYIGNKSVTEYLDQPLLEELDSVLSRAITKLKLATDEKFLDSKSVQLLNSIVELFKIEVAKKTGQPQIPSKTGFATYASNRLKIETAVKEILSNVNKTIDPINEYVGSLGEKGELYVRTNLRIHDGLIWDSSFVPAKGGIRKSPQKDFVNKIIAVSKYVYSTELFEKIAELNQVDGIESITGVSDLFLFYRHFTLNDEVYNPSNGESSMILLYQELVEEKEIYLIDEPEKSLGNDYISDVIVPLFKEKALLGKKIIVATHDANIAVRTLPYNSIYRLHDLKQYYTLTGNPFSNKLKCIHNIRPELDWKEISMKTLEGGKQAFGERGKIYGN